MRRFIETVIRFPPPPPRPQRIDVRIIASDGRAAPIGRTRPLRLTGADLAKLVEAAELMEARP